MHKDGRQYTLKVDGVSVTYRLDGFEAVKDKLAAAIAAERFKAWRDSRKKGEAA